MYESIKNFNKQFLYEPEIKNQEKLAKKSSFLVVGMGGSAHAPKLLKNCKPILDILIHQDYGMPKIPEEKLKNMLVILSSYSGNTEEVIDAFDIALKKGLNMAVISVGGKLLKLAKDSNVPYIELPNIGIQPRLALGFSIKAFLKLIDEEELKKVNSLVEDLDPTLYEEEGKKIAEEIKYRVPIIYTSNHNSAIAEIWKIKLNESGKIPAFYNVLPELNHNEMTGFDVKDSTRNLSEKFYFLILRDKVDYPKIQKRMDVLEELYKKRGLKVKILDMESDKGIWHKLFSSLVLGDWIAYYVAEGYELDPEHIPMVEEFKKLIAE